MISGVVIDHDALGYARPMSDSFELEGSSLEL